MEGGRSGLNTGKGGTGEERKRSGGGSDGMKEERRTEGPGGKVKGGSKEGKEEETGTGEAWKGMERELEMGSN